jgi:hypothetical protein
MAGGLLPLGFLLVMLGFGLRLDTGWDRLAGLLLAAGAVACAFGLAGPRAPGRSASDGPGTPPRDAFTPDDDGR